MIESITLQDFQVHKNRTVRLDPEVTTIVGPSDVGKSAVIRALQWLAFNRPSGDSFIRGRNKKRTALVVLSVDGRKIARRRGAGINTYEVDGDAVFEGMASGVPSPISSLLNLSEVNFQAQHDSPFWLCETAGEVSRQLNGIVNLGVIDTTLANIASKIRENRAEAEVIQSRLDAALATRNRLRYIRKVDRDLRAVESLDSTTRQAAQNRDHLADLIHSIVGHQERYSDAMMAVRSGENALEKGFAWAGIRAKRERLMGILQDARCQEKMSMRAIPDLRPLEVLAKKVEKIRQETETLRSLVLTVKRAACESQRLSQEAAKEEREWERLMGDRCPLCGQAIP